ncbi:hypothetical protein [Streptomyces sp. NPDC059003]|uniref:hypothetical protein n=1 Tax=Streptomyces sp. NPDC059003 TaxID=3346691 RepID=UPI0036AE2A86
MAAKQRARARPEHEERTERQRLVDVELQEHDSQGRGRGGQGSAAGEGGAAGDSGGLRCRAAGPRPRTQRGGRGRATEADEHGGGELDQDLYQQGPRPHSDSAAGTWERAGPGPDVARGAPGRT